jgi:hypothetical protein
MLKNPHSKIIALVWLILLQLAILAMNRAHATPSSASNIVISGVSSSVFYVD